MQLKYKERERERERRSGSQDIGMIIFSSVGIKIKK
jgi:hypothetical protein